MGSEARTTGRGFRDPAQRLLGFALACLTVVLIGDTARAVTLTEDGQSRATIVLENNPSDASRLAVQDLAMYLEKVSGAEVPLVDAGQPVETPATIYVGREHVGLAERFEGVDLSVDAFDEILIAARGDNVLIMGRTAKLGGSVFQRGTSVAIYRFIEKYLGVRWFWPGELGTDVPDRPTIKLEPFVHRYHPPLRQRYVRIQHYHEGLSNYRGGHESPRQVVQSLNEESDDWRRRHKMGLSYLGAVHAFTDWWEKYHESHPEYFALQPNGKRSGYPKPSFAKLCISNEGVIEQWTEDAVAQFRKKDYLVLASASPNDGTHNGFCVCEDCRAWDANRGPMVKLSWKDNESRHVALTDRYARWWNILARRLRQRLPDDREAFVGAMAYGAYRTPPVEVELEKNIIIGYVGGFPQYSHRRRQQERENWRGWAAKASKMYWRPNLFYYDRGMPLAYMERSAEDFAWLTEHDMIGVDVDSLYGHWAVQGLQYYVLAKLTWNPNLEIDKLLDDYMKRAFGTDAGPYMRRYFESLEKIFHEKAERSSEASGGLERIAQLPSLYTPRRLEVLKRMLDQALAAVKDGEQATEHRKRIEFFQTGLKFTWLQIRAIAAMNTLRNNDGNNRGALGRAIEASKQRDAFLDAQLDRHTVNTVQGFANWGANDVLFDYFGPPDDTFRDQ